ncbi:FAD/NAD(P)-binding domain-containing protein [Xylariomycetidae sp. FL0641]|nr:FAD/NAD(P)-binding domain-containing protein [Xylariomycetidae sp. FL0641]
MTATRTQANPYRILIAGGCYSGLSAAINLLEKCDTIESPIPVEITIVDERDGFYHVIGSPLALATRTYAEKAWVDYKDVKILQRPDVRFVHGTLVSIDPESKTATITERGPDSSQTPTQSTVAYDFFIAATGLRRAWPVVPQALSRKAYLAEAGAHIDAVRGSRAPVLVVGGGAVGIEMAAELKDVQPATAVTLAHSRDKLLSAEPLPDMVKDCALELTRQTGVEVLLGHRVVSDEAAVDGDGRPARRVRFGNGAEMLASVVVMAVSRAEPSTSFLPRAALTADGYARVRPSMQLQEAPGLANAADHFAVGDLIHWSGIKRCGAAMHEGKYAALNIHQLMLRERGGDESREPVFMELQDIPPMIGLAVGKNAVSFGPEGMNSGKQVMQRFFEDDLGFRIVWDYLRLGGV